VQTLWSDHIRFTFLRSGDTNREIAALMSFYSILEVQETKMIMSESVRLTMAPETARSFVDVMCRQMDYYPTKPEAAEQ
jgi:hypothetical protein